jgi:hypothetical protein
MNHHDELDDCFRWDAPTDELHHVDRVREDRVREHFVDGDAQELDCCDWCGESPCDCPPYYLDDGDGFER